MSVVFNDAVIERTLNRKIRLSVVLVTLLFVFMFLRLGYMQILKGGKYSVLSTNNRIRITQLPAPRGNILSKTGSVLVTNHPSFDLNLTPQDTPDIACAVDKIAGLLDMDRELLLRRVKKKQGRPPFEPVTLKKELSWAEMSRVLSKKMELPGITIEVVPKRSYRSVCRAPHVFGFLGEINREELGSYENHPYDIGDMIGKYGLERWGEFFLRGSKGGLQTEVDVHGTRQKILAELRPKKGRDIVVSLLPALQKTANRLLSGHTGAIVAIEPSSGEVLALASAPAFNSNLFARGIDVENWKQLIENPQHPLLNRAIQTQQPPGSVFKIVTLIAALEEGIIDPSVKFYCPGHFKLGTRNFNCWKKSGHGWMDMRQALVESCDVYFYNLALKVGIDLIAQYARKLGLGMLTQIELENEKSGLVPTPQWKQRRFGKPWQKGETLNVAIGQGSLLATPLQIAAVYSGLANRGRIMKPHLVLSVEGQNPDTSRAGEILHSYQLKPETVQFITDALVGVLSDQHGTGRAARVAGVSVAGKTGTAQVASKKTTKDIPEEDLPVHLRNHAWFAAFAPADHPQIAVCVFIEHGGSGGSVAAPMAGWMIQTYLSLKNETPRGDLACSIAD